MRSVVFITPADARYGFSLAGSQQLSISASQAEKTLRQTIRDEKPGVIAIDERLVGEIDAKEFAELERRFSGLLVTLPAPETAMVGEDDLQRLIRRALGYHVRLGQ